MPDQFTVPQFIDAEDKIIFFITARQFIIMLAAIILFFLLFRLLRFVPFLLTGIPLLVAAGIVAFVRVNGQPFHFFILNGVQTLKRPKLRVWNKGLTTAEVKAYITKEPEPLPPPPPRKRLVSSSKLKELSLIVNTGGAYRPEGYDEP